MSANWYPLRYENTPQFRRDMAMPSIASWLFLFVFGGTVATLWPFLGLFVQVLLIFRCLILFEPFKSYGGQRVYDWNKAVFGLFAAVSVVLILFVL